MASFRGTLVSSIRLLIALTLVLAAQRSAVRAERSDGGSLRLEVAEAAKSIKQFLKGQDRDRIAVGAFTAGGTLTSSAGPNVARLLVEELKKAGVDITNERDALKVEGRYIDADDKETKLLVAKITFRIVNRRDEEQVKFEREVFGDATVPILFGLSAELPPKGDLKERDGPQRDGLDHPSVHVEGARIAAVRGSNYAIELLVEQGGEYKQRKPEVKDGLAFVSIRRGEKYAVRLINSADHEVAVTLAIDGINMFAFTENPPKDIAPDSQVIVGPKSTVLIRGWYRNNNVSEEFLVTDYAKSAAAELKRSGANVGTITACFSAAWPKDGKPPADEPKTSGANSRSAEAATGRGKRFEEKYAEVECNIGVVRAIVSVRYNR